MTTLQDLIKSQTNEEAFDSSAHREQVTVELASAIAFANSWAEKKHHSRTVEALADFLRAILRHAIAVKFEIRGLDPWEHAWAQQKEQHHLPFKCLLESSFYLFESGVSVAVQRYVRACKVLGVSREEIEATLLK